MSERSVFLGSVMKAIACTPNQCFDNELYQKGVIEPARRIRQLQEELGDQPPDEARMREALELLFRIFETKGVDPAEREDRIKEILAKSRLEALFPDLFPLPR